MSIAALAAAVPLVGQVATAVGDVTKAVAPLLQPFADLAAKSLGDLLKKNDAEPNKSVEFASLEVNKKQTLTFGNNA